MMAVVGCARHVAIKSHGSNRGTGVSQLDKRKSECAQRIGAWECTDRLVRTKTHGRGQRAKAVGDDERNARHITLDFTLCVDVVHKHAWKCMFAYTRLI